jgi:cytochrome c6
MNRNSTLFRFPSNGKRGQPAVGPCDIVRKTILGGLFVKHLFSSVGLAILLACGFTLVSTSAQAQDAAATYKAKCAMCHGADGKGGKMGTRDFASPEVQKETDAQLTEAITKGRGKMPSYEGKLKESEIKDLVAYVRTLGKK